jgi:hypothetical protein
MAMISRRRLRSRARRARDARVRRRCVIRTVRRGNLTSEADELTAPVELARGTGALQ